MTTATIEELTDRVRALLAESDFRNVIHGVTIEPALSADDWEVLRVCLEVADGRKVDIDKANALISRIVDSLMEIDDRFPSVRFAEAA